MNQPANFEEAMEELEQIVQEMEGGDLGLEQSVNRYERGRKLLTHCKGVLAEAEKRMGRIASEEEKV